MATVFESPDKGETVYVREEGSASRTLYSESEKKKSLHDQIMESILWDNIHRAAETNPALQEALDRVKVIYYLSNEHSSRHNR
jgi:hypothetical protein